MEEKMNRFRLFAMMLVVVLTLSSVAFVGAQGQGVTFFSTQFNIVEEAAKARAIFSGFSGGTVNFVPSEEGPMIDTLKAESQAGKGVNDVVGALHGTFPALAANDLMLDQSELLAEIAKTVEINEDLVRLGKLGTTDFQYYIPWMQATYTMAARKEALQYLPEGADINALTWAQVAAWAKNIQEKTGKPGLALPVKGLFNRLMQGYLYPSFTGGMVTNFKSKEAADMFVFLRDELWPYVNPESINYDNMGALLASGEVMVTWDHVARLKPGFDAAVADLVAFPAPAGPAGRGYMPIIVGVGIPATAANPTGAQAFIKFLLSPETQGKIMAELGFYPVVAGVDTSNLPAGVAAQFAAVQTQGNSKDAVPSLLPVGLGARGGDLNTIYRNVFSRIVIEKQDIQTVLNEEAANLQKLLNETGAPCWAPDPASEGPCQVK
jgi:multiple sugar transport system substrate-binding protein